jgi:hypothetical protein
MNELYAAMKTTLVVLAFFCSVSVSAQIATPFKNAQTGRGYKSLQAAVDSIGAGQGTIVIAPGTYRQCAVQKSGVIAFRAAIPGQSILDGKICDKKAALVLRGQDARIDGMVFQNMRTPDFNGAGIRLEKGNLTVTRAVFRNSEQGITTLDDKAGNIRIDQSSFSGLGHCGKGLPCTHSIDIGGYKTLNITKSRFERGNGGDYVKSRALAVTINDNAFDDSRGRDTAYMINLSVGAVGRIARNIFVHSRYGDTNRVFIAVAPDGRTQSSEGLSINANEANLAQGDDKMAVFLADWSGDGVALGGNRLGRGIKPFEKR